MKKVESKILSGVKPFNDFWFKSCYYHQLISGLHILGIDGRDILLNDFAYFGKDFSFDNDGIINERELSKAIGYKILRVNINEKKLIKSINKGYPVIVGVDCYYLESRKETYKKTHSSHFILVYGYDKLLRQVSVIDHNYINSYMFEEKILPIDNLLESNSEYRKNICKAKNTSMVLLKRKNIKECDFLKLIISDKEKLIASQVNIQYNFTKIREIFNSGASIIQENYEKMVGFVEKAKASRLSLSKTKMIAIDDLVENILKELVSSYTYFTALLWKMFNLQDFNYAESRLDKILRKIEATNALETKFYEILIGAKI